MNAACLSLGLALSAASTAWAQVPQPKLTATQPCGAKAGTTVDVRITGGADLDQADRLVFSHAGITAAPVVLPPDRLFPQGKPVPNLFKVTVAADVPPGIYDVRAAGYFGISNARRFEVGDGEEALEKEPNNDPAQAPELAPGTTLNGVSDGPNFDHVKFAAKKGQRLLIECTALQIDSKAQMVLTLLEPGGREIEREGATRYRDPSIDFTAPEDGTYLLRLNDLTFRGGDDYFYRLRLSTSPRLDYADPPVLRAGAENPVTLYGRNLPGGTPAEGVTLDGRPLEKLAVTIRAPADPSAPSTETLARPSDATADVYVYRLAGSNPLRFAIGDEPLVAEAEPNNEIGKAQPLTPPVQVVGRFHPAGDRDGYLFEAKKGEQLWIEVTSQRLGLPTDPAIVLQSVTTNDKGEMAVKDIQETDDQPTPLALGGNLEKRYRLSPEDPALLFSPPADGKYRVVVRDLYFSAEGDPRFLYRLVIRPARPDFRLICIPVENYPAENKLNPGACVLRRGGAERVRVLAYRREGFDGAIRVEAEGLPPGVTARPATLAAGDSSKEFVFHAAPDAAPFAGTIRLVGHAEIDGKAVARQARSAEVVWIVADMQKDALSTRVTEEIALAVDARTVVPVSAQAPESFRTSRGGKLKIPVKLVKNADFKDQEKAQVKLVAVGLPGTRNDKSVVAKEVTLTLAKPDGEIELDFTEKAPVGPFSFYLAGDLDVPFLRNPDRAKKMEEERKRVEQVAAEVVNELKAAEAARQKAEQEAQQASEAVAQAKASGAAEAVLNTAEEKLKAANEARQRAVEAEQKLKDIVKAAEPAKKELADESKKAADAAKEKKIKMWVGSPAIAVDVAAHPISFKASPEAPELKPGGSVEVTLDAVREFGFADEVKFEFQAGGSNLRLAAPLAVAAGQAQAKGTIAADKSAKAGTHTVTLRAQIKFNNRPLTLDVPVQVKVVAAP